MHCSVKRSADAQALSTLKKYGCWNVMARGWMYNSFMYFSAINENYVATQKN